MSRNFLTPLVLPAGTATKAPLSLQSGTNLTTAAAGAVEYDGKVIYSTPAGRGVSPSMMFYRLNSQLVGSNTSSTQSLFNATVSLQANTVYVFELVARLDKGSGTTSHTVGISFTVSQTLSNFNFQGTSATYTSPFTDGFSSTTNNYWANNVGTTIVTPTNTANSISHFIMARGSFATSANAPTFRPSYICSSAPGGAYSTMVGSYILIYPIGASGSNTSVGPWA